jgi:hypothetical protein
LAISSLFLLTADGQKLNVRFAEGPTPPRMVSCACFPLCGMAWDSVKESGLDARVTGAANAERGEIFL